MSDQKPGTPEGKAWLSRWLFSTPGMESSTDVGQKLYSLGFGTNHEVQFLLELTCSWRVVGTLLALGAMGTWAATTRRTHRLPPLAAAPIRRQPLRKLPNQPPAPQLPPSGRWRFLQGTGFGIFLSAIALADEQSKTDFDFDDDNVASEDESLIRGSRQTSLTVDWRRTQDRLCKAEAVRLGQVELGGASWDVEAKRRGHDIIGFYLNHTNGTKHQIAFSMQVADVSSPESVRVLVEERHGGNWVLHRIGLMGLAADGKGACARVKELEAVQSLLIQLTAHGPVTKYRHAV